MTNFIDRPDGIFPSVCSLDCPDQCGLLLHKKNGKITKIEGDPNHPVTKGYICNKVRNMTERIYDEKRLKYPMKRVGAKGDGEFVRISWDEAIDTITTRWKELLKSDSAESILPYSFYGNMGNLSAEGMDRRFLTVWEPLSLIGVSAILLVLSAINIQWAAAMELILRTLFIPSYLYFGELMR